MFGCHLSVPFQPCCGSSPLTNAWRLSHRQTLGGWRQFAGVGDDGFYPAVFLLWVKIPK